VTTVNKTAAAQSLSVTLTDSDLASSNTTCNIDAKGGGTGEPGPGPGNPPVCTDPNGCKPQITINKKPSVTLNKNGQCTISWTIANLPVGATCSVGGWGVNIAGVVGTIDITPPLSPTSKTILNLQSNQKYTITCNGSNMTTPITASVICRVNPDVKEN
jgi:hypothetical protein